MQHLSQKKARTARALSLRQQKIYDFLSSHRTGVLSTVTPGDNPHGTVIYYGINDKFVACFLTESGTQKYDNILHHNRVMLTIFDDTIKTVAQIIGSAKMVESPDKMRSIAMTIWETCMGAPSDETLPVTKLQVGHYIAFEITPVQIHMATYSQGQHGDYADLFESIESFDFMAD